MTKTFLVIEKRTIDFSYAEKEGYRKYGQYTRISENIQFEKTLWDTEQVHHFYVQKTVFGNFATYWFNILFSLLVTTLFRFIQQYMAQKAIELRHIRKEEVLKNC